MKNLEFKVATFNFYNLALPSIPFHHKQVYSFEDYQKKKKWIVQQLDRMEADIIGFQEVIHEQALKEILTEVEGHQQSHLLTASLDENQSSVAFLSKFPILNSQIFRQFPAAASFNVQGIDIPFQRFSKPVLLVKVALNDTTECTFLVVHLKSKAPILPSDCDPLDPEQRAKGQARALILRAAEATALRILLLNLLQGTNEPVMVMGDVNDGGLAVTSQILTGDPPRRQLNFHKKLQIWDVMLYSVKDIQEKQSHNNYYYTHIHNGHYQSLDHILVSQEWVTQNPHRIGQVLYVSVFNDHLIDDTQGYYQVKPWQSDHGQVVAHFRLHK